MSTPDQINYHRQSQVRALLYVRQSSIDAITKTVVEHTYELLDNLWYFSSCPACERARRTMMFRLVSGINSDGRNHRVELGTQNVIRIGLPGFACLNVVRMHDDTWKTWTKSKRKRKSVWPAANAALTYTRSPLACLLLMLAAVYPSTSDRLYTWTLGEDSWVLLYIFLRPCRVRFHTVHSRGQKIERTSVLFRVWNQPDAPTIRFGTACVSSMWSCAWEFVKFKLVAHESFWSSSSLRVPQAVRDRGPRSLLPDWSLPFCEHVDASIHYTKSRAIPVFWLLVWQPIHYLLSSVRQRPSSCASRSSLRRATSTRCDRK